MNKPLATNSLVDDILLLALSRGQGFYSTEVCRLLAEGTEWNESIRKYLSKFLNPSSLQWAEDEIQSAKAQGIRIVRFGSDEYPSALSSIVDPPLLLFCRGKFRTQSRVSVVGARRASSYGIEVASAIGAQLSRRGVALVSGLALGIDSAVHQGALDGLIRLGTESGQLIAVLGTGIGQVYPRQNQRLCEKIIDSGGVIVSEYGVSTRPAKHLFPRRNRIISGLSEATIVVEAKEKSGSLITARLANEQGREVFAVPGPIDSPLSRGCNELIKEGATPFIRVDDLVEQLGLEPTALSTKEEVGHFGPIALAILRILENGEIMSIDEISNRIDSEYCLVQGELALLEIQDEVARMEGYCYARKCKIDIV
jgi:DNA processing protein